MKSRLAQYLIELGAIFDGLDDGPLHSFAEKVARSQRLFVGGFGRTGAILQSFAMRMNQLNHATFFLLEAGTPAIAQGDLVLVGSGSGTTETTLAITKEAQKRAAEVTAITGNVFSPLGQIADFRILIPPFLPPELVDEIDVATPVQAGFEQALALILDALTARIGGLIGSGGPGFDKSLPQSP